MLPLSKKRKPVYRNFATKYFFGWRQMRIALIINIHASALKQRLKALPVMLLYDIGKDSVFFQTMLE
jgi:hypothetical protein